GGRYTRTRVILAFGSAASEIRGRTTPAAPTTARDFRNARRFMGSSFNIDGDPFDRIVHGVLFGVGLGRVQAELAGLALALVVEVYHHVIHGVLVIHALLIRPEAYAQHAHLVVLEFELVVFRIELEGVEVRSLVRLRLPVQLYLDDANRVVRHLLALMQTAL